MQRPVRQDGIEMMPRHPLIAEDGIVGALRDQHRRIGPRGCIGENRILQGTEPMHAGKLQMRQFGRAGKEMHMRFDEAGKHRAALGVDDCGGGALESLDGGAAAHGQDGTILDGNGFGSRIGIIHGQHAAIDDDEIGMVTSDRHRDSALLTDQDRPNPAPHA